MDYGIGFLYEKYSCHCSQEASFVGNNDGAIDFISNNSGANIGCGRLTLDGKIERGDSFT